ncbi:MAG: glycosyltransferase, partial [Clostridiales bacterium]
MIISIITPTYNSERTIATNVESVLLQKFTDFEHIIIDNKSTDKTLSIIESLYKKAGKANNLRIISEPDKGISDAFNKGIRNAHGEIIGILNSDDYYY